MAEVAQRCNDRGVQAEDVAIPVETEPGEIAQVDFGYVGKLYDAANEVLRKAWVFVMVLGGGILNQAAVAGGKPKPGATKYYEATSAMELDMALQAIAGGIIVPTCSFQLQTAPPDPDNVTVTINGMPVPRSPSHGNGWDYHPNAMTITFFGTYCSQIMGGANTDVSFVYGCPGPIIN